MKKAFTLIELIVVITILAILGTISFISLQGYSAGARDSKRLTDVRGLASKINIEITKGAVLSELIVKNDENDVIIGGKDTKSKVGISNFKNLKENSENYKDPLNKQNYPAAYAEGGTGSGIYKFAELATVNERENKAVVVGNYYKMNPDLDSPSLFVNEEGEEVVHGGDVLPYNPENKGEDNSGGGGGNGEGNGNGNGGGNGGGGGIGSSCTATEIWNDITKECEEKIFAWSYSEWGACSATVPTMGTWSTCNNGTQTRTCTENSGTRTRNAKCIIQNNYAIVDESNCSSTEKVLSESCKTNLCGGDSFPKTRECNVSYERKFSNWSACTPTYSARSTCSRTCGYGGNRYRTCTPGVKTQTRTATCIESVSGKTVSDSLCNSASKLISQSCNATCAQTLENQDCNRVSCGQISCNGKTRLDSHTEMLSGAASGYCSGLGSGWRLATIAEASAMINAGCVSGALSHLYNPYTRFWTADKDASGNNKIISIYADKYYQSTGNNWSTMDAPLCIK